MEILLRNRYLSTPVINDLNKKMVFVGGPRQVGKTTFSKNLKKSFAYLNWDDGEHREKILKGKLPNSPLLIFDEIHKYKNWRNWLKGKFDTLRENHQFLVTGSARLDFYRYGGDSLQGRYFYYRLAPLSVSELDIQNKNQFMDLMELSGFPEPFFSSSKKEYSRWSRDYRTRFLREEITSLEKIDDIGQMELLALRLPELVASPLSINALREDLQKSHKTVSRYVDILERLYHIFRLPVVSGNKIRSVKKEKKHYHYDWGLVEKPGARLENLVAVHLLKWCQFMQDSEGRSIDLQYFRDSDGREVDFVIVENREVQSLIEVKTSTLEISPHLKYLKAKYPKAQAFQIHLDARSDFISKEGIHLTPAWIFLRTLV